MKRRLSVLALMVAVILAVGLVNVPYAFGNEAEPAIEEPVEGVSEDGMVEEDPDEVTTDGLAPESEESIPEDTDQEHRQGNYPPSPWQKTVTFLLNRLRNRPPQGKCLCKIL